MNGSALLHYFRYFSKYSHWICIFDHSKWNLQIDFLSQFSRWQVKNFPCVFFAIISFHISEYWLKKSPEARVQRVFSSYSRLHTIRRGRCIENKISYQHGALVTHTATRSETSQYLQSRDFGHFPICHLDKKKGSNKISRVRRLPVTQALQVKSSEEKKKTAASSWDASPPRD